MAGVRAARRAVVASVACLLVGCLPAATGWTPPTGTSNGRHCGVIGDSLVFQAERGSRNFQARVHRLTDRLSAIGCHVSTSDFIGASTPDLFGANHSSFDGFPAPGADIQVIALGTNDAHRRAVPVDRYEANLRRYIDALPETTCIWLVNIYTGATSWGLDVTGPAYNDAQKHIASDHANVRIADWNAIAHAHPSYFRDPTQPHANAAGQQAYRDVITLATALCAASMR
jgi:hypothetical protein